MVAVEGGEALAGRQRFANVVQMSLKKTSKMKHDESKGLSLRLIYKVGRLLLNRAESEQPNLISTLLI